MNRALILPLLMISLCLSSCSTPSPAEAEDESPGAKREVQEYDLVSAAPGPENEAGVDEDFVWLGDVLTPEDLLAVHEGRERNIPTSDSYRNDPAFAAFTLVECSDDSDCPDARCVPRDSIDCSNTQACHRSGHCSTVPAKNYNRFGEYVCSDTDVCGAATDDDCRSSTRCAEAGTCTAGHSRSYYTRCHHEDELCYDLSTFVCLLTDESCVHSEVCREHGWCGYRSNFGGGRCTPMADEHCAYSAACLHYGNCSLYVMSSHYCVPSEEAHCRQSEVCRIEGRCSLPERAQPSTIRGNYTLCRALSDADCQSSQLCRREGRCTAEQGRCVAS